MKVLISTMLVNPSFLCEINQIHDSIVKRILKTPESTPREALYMETGLLDPEALIKRNRINMEARIKNGNNLLMKEVLKSTHENSWAKQNEKLKKELEITDNDMEKPRSAVKAITKEKIKKLFKKKLETTSKNKSKMEYYLEGKKEWKPQKRANYMQELTRNQVSTIFKTRARMIKVKANYKNGNENLVCRLCKKEQETQQHILEECEIINQKVEKATKDMVFDENVDELRKTAKIIENRLQMLEESNQPCYKESKKSKNATTKIQTESQNRMQPGTEEQPGTRMQTKNNTKNQTKTKNQSEKRMQTGTKTTPEDEKQPGNRIQSENKKQPENRMQPENRIPKKDVKTTGTKMKTKTRTQPENRMQTKTETQPANGVQPTNKKQTQTRTQCENRMQPKTRNQLENKMQPTTRNQTESRTQTKNRIQTGTTKNRPTTRDQSKSKSHQTITRIPKTYRNQLDSGTKTITRNQPKARIQTTRNQPETGEKNENRMLTQAKSCGRESLNFGL